LAKLYILFCSSYCCCRYWLPLGRKVSRNGFILHLVTTLILLWRTTSPSQGDLFASDSEHQRCQENNLRQRIHQALHALPRSLAPPDSMLRRTYIAF
jgi:hypothetical protein